MAPSYVDSHCHLDDPAFAADRDLVIARAQNAGVRYLLAIGGASGPENIDSALRIAEAAEGSSFAGEDQSGSQSAVRIFAAGGIHPHEAVKAEKVHFEEIRRLARHPRFLAVGEIGLDYHYNHSPRSVQSEVFITQLDMARELTLPVIIHCRDAWADLRQIIREHWLPSKGRPFVSHQDAQRGILHCFSGTSEDAFELMNYGFMVSFAGNITFKKADDLRAVARQLPLDRVLTETDCPYLAPMPYRGKRNEPVYVREVTRELSGLHGISEEKMGQQVLANFVRFFGLKDAD
jgi:TatD DNase family protein